MQKISMELHKLLVNQENYRFKNVTVDQQEAMLTMLQSQKNKIIELAKDIAEHGLNPTKSLEVIETSDGKYVILDGNRRATSLKLITNPNAIPGNYPFKSAFEDLHAKYKDSLPTAVECTVYAEDEQEIADRWILLEHTGENQGRGTVSWDSEQRQRFQSKHKKELSRLVQVLEFLEAKGINISGIQATNLERLIGTTAVRQHLGIDFANKNLVLTAPEQEVIQRFRKIIERMSAKNFGVSDIYTAEQRQELIKDVLVQEPSVLPSVPAFPKKTSTPPPVSPPVNITNTNTNANNANTTIQNTIQNSAPVSHPAPNPAPKAAVKPSPKPPKTPKPSKGDTNSSQPTVSNGNSNTPTPPQPSPSPSPPSNNQNSYQTLINPAKSLPLTTPDKITEIYKELQTVTISGSRAAQHAVGALLRILVEITAQEYLMKTQQFYYDKSNDFRNPADPGKTYSELHEKLKYIITNCGLPSNISQVLRALTGQQLMTAELNQVMHSTLFTASGTAIKDLWKNFEKVFDHLINEIQ